MINKSFCEDLTEGKFSFPIIHAILKNPEDHRLLSMLFVFHSFIHFISNFISFFLDQFFFSDILKQRTEDTDLKRYAVEYMKTCGSFEYTSETLSRLREEITQELDRLNNILGANTKLTQVVKELYNLS
jgi:geranylgeranyl diphosphate synthase type 3